MMQRTLLSPLCALAMTGMAVGQSPDAIDEVFPATSFACVQFEGLDACSASAKGLGLVGLGRQAFASEAASPYRAQLQQMLSRGLPKMRRQLARLGASPELLRTALSQPMGLAVGRFTIFAGQPMPSLALAIRVADEAHGDELVRVVERLLQRAGPEIEVEQTKVDGTPVTTFSAEGHSGAVLAARVGGYLLLSNSRGYLAECIATSHGKRPSLSSLAGYKAGRDELSGTVLASLFVNTEPFAAAIGPFVPYEMSAICDALGTSALDGLFLGAAVDGNGSVNVAQLGIKGPETGVLRSAFGRPASFAAAELCPADTLVFATGSFDSRAMFAAIERFVATLPEEAQHELRREFGREMRRELRGSGMSQQDLRGLVELFGPEVTLAVTAPGGSSLVPEIALFVDVADPARAAEFMKMALGNAKELALKETSYKGTPITYSRALSNQPVPYTPAMALHEGRLVVASSVQSLKSVLARSMGDRANLAQAEDFAAHMSKARGSSMFGCMRSQALLPDLWNKLVPLAEKALIELDGDLDPEILPTREDLAAALSDSVVTMSIDEHGITMRDECMLGLGSWLAAGGWLVDEALRLAPPEEGVPATPPAPRPAKKPSIF